ncbi:hypothetical protein AMJ86_07905 [bacterium SM23_57]|nr:MAG: hypothetical protein AMJ86_07905 [bacterium SM23_57]
MNITVNGAPYEMTMEQNATLGQVYKQLVNSLTESGMVVAGIEINGEAMPGGRIWDLSSQSITEIQTLDLMTRQTVEMVHEAFESADQHLQMLISETEKTATMFRVGEELGAQDRFSKCVSGLQWFLKALDALRGMMELDYTNMAVGGNSVEATIQEFVPMMDDILEAQAENDAILIADLLEYELVPKINRWRELLPELEEKTLASVKIPDNAGSKRQKP